MVNLLVVFYTLFPNIVFNHFQIAILTHDIYIIHVCPELSTPEERFGYKTALEVARACGIIKNEGILIWE